MKIAYVTHYDILNKQTWPNHATGHFGTSYYKAKVLEAQSESFEYICPLETKYSILSKIKIRFYKRIAKQLYHPWAETYLSKGYAQQLSQKLSQGNSEIIVCPEMIPVAYLECKQPIVIWISSSYAGLIGSEFYPAFMNMCQETHNHLVTMDRLALDRCKLVIFPSQWAAKTAIDTYGITPSKVKVIPNGTNAECNRSIDDIKNILKVRHSNKCKLLFCGVDWIRKGGDTALEVAKQLHRAGLNVELTVVGCKLIIEEDLPNFVRSLGFIDKSTEEGLNKMNHLFAESHFLILPSKAETYGNVLCEANSFGVPCLSTDVGGIPTIIKDNLNGKVFSLDANIAEYCMYISNLFSNYSEYEQLALSSSNEYETRLNWPVAGRTAKKLIEELA